ncbi:unnamed protein product [Staurois parvus]|uniref:Uncharacterized protein n=1 Tax=Staurois parvus TaxID=386267 RepID=A0ABN9DM13_9NEOB|nr:unnamed protein product [Staurois parvus]
MITITFSHLPSTGWCQCRVGWPFINCLPAPCLCALLDPVPAVSSGHSGTPIVVRGPDHVITDWPISDHMQSSKQDVTSDIIAYYLLNL